ncbi:cold-shock protein [Rhizobium sp. FY34]|uniref:cold-shock protein n=1 Tax=Rhizobium sp. FY34 TaxID=2562309 RepID=UPI0010C0A291|nr:cold-shock protein [Rhizobium sp. FY34]
MQRPTYSVGDKVVLKTAADGGTDCRISAVLPSAYGHAQYRVRFENETFERRIVQADIDPERSNRSAPEQTAALPKKGSSWLNPSTMKIGK